MKRTRVGIIGCGNICPNYLRHLRLFDFVEVAACADAFADRAESMARAHEIPRACSVDELLDEPTISIVANLTPPQAHFDVAMRAIEAGKHVYNEKPLTLDLNEAKALLAAAEAKGLRVGCAPDTFLGAGLQTCRKLIDDGEIGEPVAATAFMMSHGTESWHPAPAFYYQKGGGPMFDMGPYYLTALTTLIGPMRRVAGMARTSFPTRTITSEPLRGTVIHVEVPTHVAGLIEFDSAADGGTGPIATIIMSFDVWAANLPPIEIHGTRGSLAVPDPNGFAGPVRLRRADEREWRDVPLTHAYAEGGRGLGIADMARAIESGRPHRANGALAAHVLDAMHAFHAASDAARSVELTTTCSRPAAIPPGLPRGVLDEQGQALP
jgi:predicted dehydrogenase